MADRPHVPDTVLTAHLDDESVLLHMDSKRYYRLNETGQRIWQLLEQGRTRDEIATTLTAEYDVDLEQARTAVDHLIRELANAELVEEAEGETRE